MLSNFNISVVQSTMWSYSQLSSDFDKLFIFDFYNIRNYHVIQDIIFSDYAVDNKFNAL